MVIDRELLKFTHGTRLRLRWTVRYAYEVDGRRYEANRLDVLHESVMVPRTGDWARVEPYPPGAKATAYVDPADPRSALLSTRVPYPAYFGVVGMVFLSAGALFLVPPRLRPAAALLSLDLLTALIWVYPGMSRASTSTWIVAGLLSLPALFFTSRALARCRRRS